LTGIPKRTVPPDPLYVTSAKPEAH